MWYAHTHTSHTSSAYHFLCSQKKGGGGGGHIHSTWHHLLIAKSAQIYSFSHSRSSFCLCQSWTWANITTWQVVYEQTLYPRRISPLDRLCMSKLSTQQWPRFKAVFKASTCSEHNLELSLRWGMKSSLLISESHFASCWGWQVEKQGNEPHRVVCLKNWHAR